VKKTQHIVIIGATSSIAEHCARLWVVDDNIKLTLVGRNGEKTAQVAADLKIRNPSSIIQTMVGQFNDTHAITKLANQIISQDEIAIVLIAHGSLPDQVRAEQDLQACSDALMINGISPVLFAEAFAVHMQKTDQGCIAIISSVAGDRGRKSNYIYGSAKGLINRYAQGLQHRFANTNVRIVLIKPGPIDTPMTAHLKQKGSRMTSAQNAAQIIVKAIRLGKPECYVPHKWAAIMMVIRHLPAFIFNRLDI
jgi:decaprenylphospho-beta-D-erythro-pentofuranosid-2-ulose 2-reductase